jgi:arylsulfatase A-like enzyme
MRLRTLLVILCLALSSWPAEAGEKKSRKPNIIILLADDLGYADLSCQGSKDIVTPHIDSLAKNGVRCTSGYVSAPYCSPTRAGMLTGRYQQRFGHEFNPALLSFGGKGQGLSLDERTLADWLKLAGYRTGMVGKWHLGEEEAYHPQRRGFDDFFGFLTGAHSYVETTDKRFGPILRGNEKADAGAYLTDTFGKEAVDFIGRNKDRPFFLYVPFNAVHTPMQAPAAAEKEFAKITNAKRRTYLAMTRKLDDAVGAILAKLRELNLEEDTLIFFLSDNGGPTVKFSPNGSVNGLLRGSKGDTWEGGIRVPFIVQWKGHVPAGKTYDQPVISLDIAATSLAAAHYSPKTDKALDGVNLLPFLEGKKADSPHAALYWRFGSQMAIRKGDFVLVRPSMSEKPYSDVAMKPMLFDLTKDIGQKKDLAAQQPEMVRAMQADWNAWNAGLIEPRWPATEGGKEFKNP